MLKNYDRGSAVVIEVEFKQHTPFGADAYFDPTSPTITITDEDDTAKVTTAALIQSTTGKYYYICQTAVDWETGVYTSSVSATSGSYTDITVDVQNFALV